MNGIKIDRILELFFRGLRGESLSVRKLADYYGVSTRSISRDITSLKSFLADHRELIGNAELIYSVKDKSYQLILDEFISSKELFAITKVLIACKPFNTQELLNLIAKLKLHTSAGERQKLEDSICKEIFHYQEIHFDCASVLDNIWELSENIKSKQVITITYYSQCHLSVKSKVIPLSIMFNDYYFYLIAYDASDITYVPKYFRIDRLTNIVINREKISLPEGKEFDEGYLRKRCQFMWTGQLQKIKFEFFGQSPQSILDKIPTAKIIDTKNNIYTIEAEVFGNGIQMYLLSQGALIKVISPESFVEDMKLEIEKMANLYVTVPK
ncbi:MAG: WYL domain-containing transcriptional regulator [Oscillospiraceae bacterium]